METDRFIEHKKREFKQNEIEYTSLNIFGERRFFKKSVKRSLFPNHFIEFAAFEFLKRME